MVTAAGIFAGQLSDGAFVLPTLTEEPDLKVATQRRERPRRHGLSLAEARALAVEAGNIGKDKKLIGGAFVELATVGQAARVVRNRKIAARSLASIKERLTSSEQKREHLRAQEATLQAQLEGLLRSAWVKQEP